MPYIGRVWSFNISRSKVRQSENHLYLYIVLSRICQNGIIIDKNEPNKIKTMETEKYSKILPKTQIVSFEVTENLLTACKQTAIYN